MKHLLSNEYLALLTRVLLGVLFIVISIEKIADTAAFTNSIANYKILSPVLASLVATVLPWIELLCGLCILFGILTRGSSLLMALMLFVFTVVVLTALLRGLDISCGCFTQDPQAGKIGWMKVAQNLSLFFLSIFLFYSNNNKLTLEQFLQNRTKEMDGRL
ncbi:MAG: DoxX family membrane protein [Ignavibacteriales bacterium]|nr:DoxX family membrane protein [Ignavibacteriales bacterium]